MQDKDYDNFFDKKPPEEDQQEKLMTMVDTVEKIAPVELEIGKLVSGTVVKTGKEFVFIDISQKNDALIKSGEFIDVDGNMTIKEGDTVEAFIISTENDEILLSKSLAGKKASTKDLIELMDKKIPLEGKVTGINKGGFNVTILGKKAFCPFSHIDIKYVEEPNKYLSQVFTFVITRVENRGRNIVLSRLPLLEKKLDDKINELEKYIEEKKPLKGTISNITKFGLFVDLGNIEGLVHVSEVSWDRAQNLKNSYRIGQDIECLILKIEKKEPLRNSKISLSIRMVGENPWENISEKLTIGSSVDGTITRLTKFGAFVQLLPGIEGLIHISEMSWGKRIHHPSDVISEGQNVKVSIIAIDPEKRSISCSLKDISDNPWNSVAEKFPVGSRTNGIVSSETKYGYFIDLDKDFTGLLVHNKIAKDKKDTINQGDNIEVTIEEIDIENCRVSLSYGLTKKEDKRAKEESLVDKKGKAETPAKPASEFGHLLRAAMEKKK